jgi:S-formylglutathione hydrolase FrmB
MRKQDGLSQIFFSLLFCYASAASAQVTVQTDTITPSSLRRPVEYQVVLPAGYDSTRRYPVLWLLHGYGGDDHDWMRLTALRRYVERYPIIVVLPDGENSWYVNAPSDPSAQYEDFISRDLHADVAHRYAVDTLRQAIAGLSMGGYGAIVLGLRNPERYRFVAGFSSALSAPSRFDPVLEGMRPSLDRAFGPRGGEHWSAYDAFLLFRNTPAASLPYIYLAIGTSDGFPTFLPLNRALADSLRTYGARYEYRERPGGHDWRFWDTELPPMLARMWVEVTRVRDAVSGEK